MIKIEEEKFALEEKIAKGGRLSIREALSLFSWDFLSLARAGDLRRIQAFPSEDVGFIVDRIINYTNICEAQCRFCAFHARAEKIAPYSLSLDEILKRVAALDALSGTQVMLQGGLSPDYPLEKLVHMVRSVKEAFPHIAIHSFSPAELAYVATREGVSLERMLEELKSAGLDSVPGASDLLVDRIRSVACAHKISVEDWVRVERALARHGLKSSATMTYGMGETLLEKIEHLAVIRDLQDETGNIRAFIPWSFSPFNTGMADIAPATGMDYLKMVAISRIFLDNVVYLQAGWLTEGLKIAQIALAMGANDMGGVLMEECVVKATGVTTKTNREELIAVIRNAGKKPFERDSAYRPVRRFE